MLTYLCYFDRYRGWKGIWCEENIQILSSPFETFLYKIIFVDSSVIEYVFDDSVVVFLSNFESHVIVVFVDVLIDLVVDYNLIFFVTHMQEDTGIVPTLSFADKVFTVLDCSKQNPESRVEMVECLNKRKRTMRATAAASLSAKVT